jgi:hypothetical protein
LREALDFIGQAIKRQDRIATYLATHPSYQLSERYLS